MKIINIKDIPREKVVSWGNGLSYRFLTKSDSLPFGITKTIVNKGTSSKLQYVNHIEVCYCISGRGSVTTESGTFEITPDIIYIPESDRHTLSADDNYDLVLVCVFSPALRGDEKHTLSEEGYSTY